MPPPPLRSVYDGAHLYITDAATDAIDRATDVFLCGVFVKEDRSFALLSIYVPPERRGRGLASALLRTLVVECERLGATRIEVDDMTERARQDRNIYAKHGFQYIYAEGPDMVLWL